MAKNAMTLAALMKARKEARKRLEDTEFGNELMARALILAEFLSKIEPSYRDREDFEYNFPFRRIIATLECFRWAHPIQTADVKTPLVDRLQPMLIGPLFTSEKYPWPRDSDTYREPISQFDLEWAGQIGGVDLGTGILQLWLGPSWDDYEIRVIPKDDFKPELLTPIPDGVTHAYFKDGMFFAGDFQSWLDSECAGESIVITGTDKPVMSWDETLYDELDDLAYNMNDENGAVITEFLEILPRRTASCAPNLFGNFDPIQYRIEDMPPCLLVLDSHRPFMWGDSGNAQVFYIQSSDGTFRFHFQWSCQ
jgi:hypothetical protein